MKMIRGYPDSRDPILSVSDYKPRDFTDLLSQVAEIRTDQSVLLRTALTQIEFDQEPPAWHTCLKDAATVDDLILIIGLFGPHSIADRLNYLHSLPVDEPYQKPINLESARGFALFIMNNVQLPYPDITVNPVGHVTIEWDVVDRGTLILKFLSSELVEYLDVFQQSESGLPKQYSSGVSSLDGVTGAVKLAIHKLMSQ